MSILRNRFSNNLFNKLHNSSNIAGLVHVNNKSRRRYKSKQQPCLPLLHVWARNNLLSRKLDKLEVIVALLGMVFLVWLVRS